MVTLFECWNGGSAQWDGFRPWFTFLYPPASPQVLGFYQLSARITEVWTNSEWLLAMGGITYDVPNLPAHEIAGYVRAVETGMGYTARAVPVALGNPMFGYPTAVPVGVWVSLASGRADMFNPMTGLIPGPQLQPPAAPAWHPQPASQPGWAGGQGAATGATSPPAPDLAVTMTPNGQLQGAGVRNLLQQTASVCKDLHSIWDFLKATGIVGGTSAGQGW